MRLDQKRNRRPKPAWLLLPLSLLLGVPVAGAQEDSEDDDSSEAEAPRFEESVVVTGDRLTVVQIGLTATKLPVSLMETPLSVNVVTAGLLEARDARVLRDALESAAGVNVATGFGVFDYFVIRGFDSLSAGLVLVDGAPEPEATFYPTYNVARVEVLKGPGVIYGANPTGGAAHLVRKQPVSRTFATASVSAGSFETFDGRLDSGWSSADGAVALRLNGLLQDSAGYRDNTASRVWALNPAVGWKPSESGRLTVNLEYVSSEYTPDTGIPYVGGELAPVERTQSYQSPRDGSRQKLPRLRVDYEHRLGERFKLRNKLYYTSLDWQSDGTLVAGLLPGPGGSPLVLRSLVQLDDDQRWLGNQLELAGEFETGSVGHELLVGFELSQQKDTFVQDVSGLLPVPLVDPRDLGGPVIPIPQLQQSGDSRNTVVAPYLLDRITFSEKVQLWLGARVDSLHFEDDATGTSRDATQLNPLGGILVSPSSQLSIYASGGTAFGPPSTQVVGERAPEESVQGELGVKWRFLDGRGAVNLAGYHLERENIAIPVGGMLSQTGTQRSRGIELELITRPATQWFATGSYAFTDSELTSFREITQIALFPPEFIELDLSGNTAPFAPRHLFSFWGGWESSAGVEVGLGGRYVSEQFIAPDNARSIDSYWRVDAQLGYRWDRARISLNLRNLAGTKYETRGFGSASAIPAPGFEIYGRVEVGFGER